MQCPCPALCSGRTRNITSGQQLVGNCTNRQRMQACACWHTLTKPSALRALDKFFQDICPRASFVACFSPTAVLIVWLTSSQFTQAQLQVPCPPLQEYD